MKTSETSKIVEKYVPKKKHNAIKEINKDIDGYDVVLNEGWLFEKNNTGFIAQTIKELIADLKNVEHFENEEYDRIMISLGNGPKKVEPEIIEIDDNDDYVDPIQVIVEDEEIEDVEETEEIEEVEKQQLIEKMNESLKAVESLKFSLEISTDQEDIDFLRNEIKTRSAEINELREELKLVRGI